MRHHLTPVRMVIIFFRMWKNWSPCTPLVWMWNDAATVENCSVALQKVKQAEHVPRDIPKRMENRSSEDACMWLSATASFAMTAVGTNRVSTTDAGIPGACTLSGVYQGTCTKRWAANPAEGGGWRTGPVRPPRHKKIILHESTYTNPAVGSVAETESAGWLPGARCRELGVGVSR